MRKGERIDEAGQPAGEGWLQGSLPMPRRSLLTLASVVLAGALSLLTGCASVKSMAGMGSAPAAPPEWVISPPADNDEAMYGLGEGLDVGTATRLALRDVASKLRVSVSGVIRSQTNEVNGRADSAASSSMMSEVQKTEFRQYTLVQSAPAPSGVYALVKVDRQAFLADTRDRIGRMEQLTTQLLATQPKPSALEHYVTLQRARPLLAAQQGLWLMFKASDLKPDDQARQARLQKLLADADSAAGKVQVVVQAAADDADVKGVLAGLLSEQGIKVADQASGAQGQLDVAAPMETSKFGQDVVVRLRARLSLKDGRGSAIGAREHLVTAASRTDARMARQQAVAKLQADLKAMGLLPALGIQPLSVQSTQP